MQKRHRYKVYLRGTDNKLPVICYGISAEIEDGLLFIGDTEKRFTVFHLDAVLYYMGEPEDEG